MSDENQGQASQPAEGSEPVNLDAETPQVETEQKETPEGEQPAEEAGEKPEGEQPERKKLSTAEKNKRRQTFLLNQLAEKDRELEALRQSRPAEGEQPAGDKPPKEEDFNGDWGKYIAAQAAYEAANAVDKRLNAREDRGRAAAQQTELRERVVEFEERADDLRDVVKDYDKVISSVDIKIREELAREVLFSEKGPQIQYHLAQNPNELQRLNALGGRELAKEIGRLEATLKLPEAKQQTQARPPLASLKGGAAPSFDPVKSDNMDEFSAWLKKDLAKRSGRQ